MSTPALPRRLGLGRSIGLGLAAVVGSGIFVLPSYVARQLPSAVAFFWIWQLGALVSLFSALSYAELATTFPETGGYVVYLRRIWGKRVAFLYGWAAMLVLYPASIAGLSRVTGRSLSALFLGSGVAGSLAEGATAPLAAGAAGGVLAKALAVGPIAAASVIAAVLLNLVRVRTGTRVQTFLGLAKVAALFALGAAGLWAARFAAGATDATGVSGAVSAADAAAAGLSSSGASLGFGAWVLGLVGVLWCYEGFLEIVVVAGEVKRPARTLVRAMSAVVFLVAVVYGIYVLALVKNLGMSAIAASSTVAADLARILFSAEGSRLIHILVAVATFSSAQALLFSGPRILVGLSEMGVIPPRLGQWSGKNLVPRTAILLCGAMALVYTTIGSFEELVKYFAFATGIFSSLILAGGIRLRMKGEIPSGCRRIPLWPLPPLVAMAVALMGSGWVFRDQPRSSAIGLLIMALSWPLYSRFLRPDVEEPAASRRG